MAWDFIPDSDEFRMMSQNQQGLLGKLWDECNILNNLLLPVIANIIDFRIEDFRKLHKHVGDQALNASNMRVIYYPEYNAESVEENYQRVSPHSDFCIHSCFRMKLVVYRYTNDLSICLSFCLFVCLCGS